ncbi:MAG: hypothetical protein WC047_04370 [Kiritimatiellales bacterium]
MELKKSISQKLRMNGRDYSRPGWYFVTLGADYHRYFFGTVRDGKMCPNALGELVDRFWGEIPQHYPHIRLGAWQLMPNHFHGIVCILRPGKAGLGEVLNLFKDSVTREARRAGLVHPVISHHGEKVPGKVWTPNYYDVICFDAEELAVRENYVRANPRRWALRDIPQGRVKKSRFKGNKALLNDFGSRRALRVSRRASEAEVVALQNELAAFDGLVCSTFFSPGERACLKTLLTASFARIIWVQPMAMPEQIPVDWTDAFLEGRVLWLSAFPDDQPDATRENCQLANHWVEQLCLSARK